MSPLVKKEIRLLLPAWFAALAVIAVLPPCLQFLALNNVPYNPDILSVWFGLGCLLLSLATFGNEFSSKTFPVQLSQPIERSSVLWTKVIILAIAFASILLALFVCYRVYFQLNPVYHIPFPFGVLTICGLVIFSGGLWTTLLVRRMLEAFWLTLLTPLAIMVTLYAFYERFHWSNQTENYVIPTVLLLYSVAGFFWACRLFLQAQDLQWTGGVIAISSRKRISTPTKVSSYPRHWFSSLVWKELQLQQVNILISAVVLTLHLASVVIRQVHPNFDSPNVRGLLELIWALWLAMPLLIGSAAVAEEHRIGVTESQFCLPVSRRVQFAIKFFTALILSLVLGGLMPFVVERGHDLNYYIFVLAAVIFFIAFYASTLARTTLQAIGLTLVLSAAMYLYLAGEAIAIARLGHGFTYAQLGVIFLKFRLGIPILLLVLAYLTVGNFKWSQPDGKLWWRNLVAVLAAFAAVFCLSHAIYFRAWELLIPIEPPHGPARLSSTKPPKLSLQNFTTISAVLPDGRLWTERIGLGNYGRIFPFLNTQKSVRGSNWVDATSDFYRILAIQSDGSLWTCKTYPERSGYPMTRIGTDTNWLQVAGGVGFLLLKNDHTLWCWIVDRDYSGSDKSRTSSATPLMRLGQETNWTAVFSQGRTYVRKDGGSIWMLVFGPRNANPKPHLEPLESWQLLNKGFASLAWAYTSMGDWTGGIKTNGELRLFANAENQKTMEVRLGKSMTWKATAFAADNSILAIREDGTLWEWPQLGGWTRNPDSVKPVQLGTYSGWIGLYSYRSYPSGCIALAADGNLWSWKDPSAYLWLAPSRKPVYLGNIFSNAN